MENEKKYKKCDLKLDKFCGLPCNDIADGYCMLQIREPEYDEETAKKISDAHELAKQKAGKVEMTRNKMKQKAIDTKKECGICTGLIFTVLCPSCKLCSLK